MSRQETISIDIVCKLDTEYFGPWDQLTPEQQSVFDNEHTRCDGSGTIGSWCWRCVFCEDFLEFDDGKQELFARYELGLEDANASE